MTRRDSLALWRIFPNSSAYWLNKSGIQLSDGTSTPIEIRTIIHGYVLEMAGWIGLASLWIITLFSYANLPEIIPVHFNLSGQVNDHGSKFVLFFLPVIRTLLLLG
jgi:uncharacterized membrane protein